MPTAAERRALAFAAAIATLGVAARVVRSRDAIPAPPPAAIRALDAQIARVDSARRASHGASSRAGRGTTRDKTSGVTARTPAAPKTPELVDLDVADQATIDRLPWIGPALASRIIENRERCGSFGSLQQLTRVNGIGEATTRRLAPYVTFSGGSRPMSAAEGSGCQNAARGAAPRRRGRS